MPQGRAKKHPGVCWRNGCVCLAKMAGDVASRHQLPEAQQVLQRQALLSDLEERYRVRQRPERPTSQLALARKALNAAQKRVQSRERVLQSAERRLAKTEAQWKSQQAELQQLQQRLARFEQENATNPNIT